MPVDFGKFLIERQLIGVRLLRETDVFVGNFFSRLLALAHPVVDLVIAEHVRGGQLIELLDPSELKEFIRGAVLDRAPGQLSTTSHVDQLKLDQLVQWPIGRYAADCFDFSTRHWLAVGNNRHRLKRGRAELHRARLTTQEADKFGKLGRGHDLKAVGALD